LWLRNRQPRLWRDKHEVDVAGADESLMDGMTEDQLLELGNVLLKVANVIDR
jgi:hypothetical protein